MSIGYKKISEMIIDEINGIDHLNERQKGRLEQLCNKIYMLEASSNHNASSKIIDDLIGELSMAADRIKDLGENA
ncbi:hypothetical protein AWR36_010470 [Microbulbifer flavimaris]|uniref:Uncharacterized protein n=1 Tax=Microbulbifer flavimaris TaxID=1781068 RepID=A0ABX4HYT5_9GAMM|nr:MULTISPECIES: hypothetical protein [Microbulbifer]KUJ82958.1 hypothetical protein AVO43_10445 [Microbulbifer sp. ZGT114]PCO05143.1 hypothetical protein AWR36_010470 [Microbulbifer flavimaris]